MLGQKIIVYTDHKNLVHESELKSSQYIKQLGLLLEVYGSEIIYIKCHKNKIADTLSRLSNQGVKVDDVDAVLPFVPVEPSIFLVNLQPINTQQMLVRDLRRRLRSSHEDYNKLNNKKLQVITYKDT